jgi:hypothetical protein
MNPLMNAYVTERQRRYEQLRRRVYERTAYPDPCARPAVVPRPARVLWLFVGCDLGGRVGQGRREEKSMNQHWRLCA